MNSKLNSKVTTTPNDYHTIGDTLCVDSYRLRLENPSSWLNAVDDSRRPRRFLD